MASNAMLAIDRGKPLSFRMYIRRRPGSGPFYRVFVFRTLAELRSFAYLQAQQSDEGESRRFGFWKDCAGLCRHYGRVIKRGRVKKNQIGVILFARSRIGGGIVSHECAHAALYVTKKKQDFPIQLTVDDDERLAWLVGHFVSQFYKWFWKQTGGE